MSGGCDRQPDSERILRSELQAVRVNNEKLSAMFRSERADHASTKAAHQEAERLLEGARQARVEAERRENEARADREHVEDAAKLVRADLDALQAAVRGLTGREGNVAAMIGDLAHVGRVFGDVVSQRADLQAARDTLSKVSAAVDAVRLAWEGEAAENVIAALDAVDRALRGVPAPASEARQCEACTAANGTATFHAPEEPCDPGADEHAVRRLSVEIAALQTTVLRQQEAIEAIARAVEVSAVQESGGR